MLKQTIQNTFRAAMAMALLGITPTYAQVMDDIRTYVPAAQKVGQGRLKLFFLDVYDAELYAPHGEWQDGDPLALQLTYLRDISGKKIADRSAEEMRDLGINDEVQLATWYAQMRDIFPDVREGTIITGIYTKDSETVFYKNNEKIGMIKDPEFGRSFFDIWLNQNTHSPDLRRKLLGAL